MNRANTITWITLMIMTVVNFAMGERHVAGWMILAIAGVKFSLVAWQFMELRIAKGFWSVALGGVLVLILAVAVILR